MNHNQLVGVGTMGLLSKQALTLRKIGHVTGGTVDKTPTRNQEQKVDDRRQQLVLNSSPTVPQSLTELFRRDFTLPKPLSEPCIDRGSFG